MRSRIPAAFAAANIRVATAVPSVRPVFSVRIDGSSRALAPFRRAGAEFRHHAGIHIQCPSSFSSWPARRSSGTARAVFCLGGHERVEPAFEYREGTLDLSVGAVEFISALSIGWALLSDRVASFASHNTMSICCARVTFSRRGRNSCLVVQALVMSNAEGFTKPG